MWTRRRLIAGLGAMALADGAAAQPQTPPAGAPTDPPHFIVDTSTDASTRMTVKVRVDGEGPFDFVVDTGADSTVLSTEVATRLKLQAGGPLTVHSIAGATAAPTCRVAELGFGRAKLRHLTLPVLPGEHLGAAGLLGVDALQGRSVVMDFARRELSVRPSVSRVARIRAPNEAFIEAATAFGRLTVLDARVDGVRTTVFMDSGGGVTIGNLALGSAIRARVRDIAFEEPVRLVSVTGQTVSGVARTVKTVDLGQVRLTYLPMAFCDLHLFEMWGLRDKPTMLLGVDAMRMFSRVELDFRNREVLLRVGANFSPASRPFQAQLGSPGLVG